MQKLQILTSFLFRGTLLVLLFFSSLHLAKAQNLINDQFIQRNTIGPFSGIATEEHPSGKKKLNIPIKNGKIEGTVREWAKNNKKVYEVQYTNGLKNGVETQWYATGDKKSEMNFQNGLASGTFTEWYKNKQKKSEGLFQNGKEEGVHQWWYSAGQLQQKATYRNGLEEGLVQNWYESGKLRLETEYQKGLKSGRSTEWFFNGKKKVEGDFKEDKEQGETRHWSKKGILVGIQTFEGGRLVKDINYRSGAINFGNGYLQVFNEKESFFTVHVNGGRVNPKNSQKEIIYSVDGQLFQLFNYPLSNVRGTEITGSNEKEIIEKYVQTEEAYIEKMTEVGIEVKKEWKETKKGIPYLKWSFVSPSSKDAEQKPRTVQQEYYLSFMCNQQILNLYSVVTNSDDPASIQ